MTLPNSVVTCSSLHVGRLRSKAAFLCSFLLPTFHLFLFFIFLDSPPSRPLSFAPLTPLCSKRMHSVEQNGAEVSCLTNSTNNELFIHSPEYDVEKTAVGPQGPVAEEHTPKTQCTSNESGSGLFGRDGQPDSDASTLTEEKENDFPEGGLKGYCVVVGAFCGLFSVFGIINASGILLEYFSTHQLKDYTSSQIGWFVNFFTVQAYPSRARDM